MKFYNSFQPKNILPLLTFLVTCSCAKPKISNLKSGRFMYEKDPSIANKAIEVGLAFVPIEEEPYTSQDPIRFINLRDSLPSIFMKELSRKEPISDSFIYKLSSIIIPKIPTPTAYLKTDYTEQEIQLRISCLKQYYLDKRFMHPNTRLEFLTVNIEIPTSAKFSFLKINKLQNEYDEIDLGKLERESESNFKTGLNFNAGTSQSNEINTANNYITKKNRAFEKGDNTEGSYNYSETGGSGSTNKKSQAGYNASADISYQNQEQIREAMDVKLKRLRVGYTNTAKKITIAQRGRIGGDISDNIYVNAVLKAINLQQSKVYIFQNLLKDSAKKWEFSDRLVKYLKNLQNESFQLPLTFSYKGLLRGVSNKWLERRGSNALEYDDKVRFYNIESKCEQTLTIDISSLYNYAVNFELEVENLATQKKDTLTLYIKPNPGKAEELKMFFADFYNVIEFENIIKNYLQEIKDNPSHFDYNRLLNSKFSLFFLYRNQQDTIHLIDSDINKVKNDTAKIKDFQMFTRRAL